MSLVPSAPKDNHPFGRVSGDSLPTPEEVRAELAKIQNSNPFIRSERIKKLLGFQVEAVLGGNQDLLKESIIGVEVFDRPPGYDCKQDPVVRVEMRRLRSKLSEYYLHEGKSDEVVIWLEKGGYIPALSKRAADVPAAQAVQPDPEVNTNAAADRKPTDLAPAESRPPRRLVWIAGASVIALIAVAFAIYFLRPAKSPQMLRVFPLAGNAGLETSPAFSPDGKQVAYSWDENRKNFDIYVKSIEGGPPHRLTDNAAHDVDPAWSPDGRQIAFLRISPDKVQVMAIPSVGGVEKVIGIVPTSVNRWHPEEPDENGGGGPAWSPDGSYVLVTGAEKGLPMGILKIHLDGRRESITTPPPGATDLCPRISPSGQYIAFNRNWGAGTFDLYVMPSSGGAPVRLTFDSRNIQGLVWLDDRNILYSSNRAENFRLWKISRSGGKPQLFSASGAQPLYPAISRDGHWLAFVAPLNDASIWRLSLSPRAQPSQAEPFISSAAEDSSPAYSPDGKKIAFISYRSGTSQIWTADNDGLEIKQLTDFKGSLLGSPHWSPDSGRLVFDGAVNNQSAIWLIDADGSNQHRLNNSHAREYAPTWSRDGKWVYFCSLRTGQDELWKQAPDSGEAVEMTREWVLDAAESSDGRSIYVQRHLGGIWQIPLAGGTPVPVPELAKVYMGRYWTLAGDTIYFVRQEQVLHKLESFNLGTRKFQELTTIPNQLLVGTPGISVDSSRNWLLFVQKSQRRSTIMLQER